MTKLAHNFCQKLNIKYPIIQAGMVWVSGANLAAACTNAGILGTIGAGSMTLELLKNQIQKAQSLSTGSLAVNVPLLYKDAQKQIDIALDAGIKIFITSAGSPKLFTKYLKDHGAIVIHVTSTPELAQKCEDAGVDMIIAEGFEAGGHNGRDEITTMVLVPEVVKKVSLPVIAAGGIINGAQMAAAMCLGASAVQMGTRFVACAESSAHENFKKLLINSPSNSTMLAMKKHVPVRLFKNQFYAEIKELEDQGASSIDLINLLGKGRAKKGMLEGDLVSGELEIGQGCSLIEDIPSAQTLVTQILSDYKKIQLPNF